jgi:hypothetical protein
MEAKPKHMPWWSQAFPNTAESAVDAEFTDSGMDGQVQTAANDAGLSTVGAFL